MHIEPLKQGDLIYITSPAKAIGEEPVLFAKSYLESRGFNVLVSDHCLGSVNYFSGDVYERTMDFQFGLDNPEVKAILCARGGYGCVQILDRIQWASQLRSPKWIIGFSDVTVLHQRMQRFEIPSIHGSMPLNFKENTVDALDTLISALTGDSYQIEVPSNKMNKIGTYDGVLVGGNLSVLCSLIGTDDQIDFTNKILFLEDLCEPLYAIDRMMHNLGKSGIFKKIKGLIIGGMTDLKDSDPPYGKNYMEIILAHFEYLNIPICFDFPAGHINDNRALVFGQMVHFKVDTEEVSLHFNKITPLTP